MAAVALASNTFLVVARHTFRHVVHGTVFVSPTLQIITLLAYLAFDFALVIRVNTTKITKQSALGASRHLTRPGRTEALAAILQATLRVYAGQLPLLSTAIIPSLQRRLGGALLAFSQGTVLAELA